MSDLIAVKRLAEWERVKALVLDSVSSSAEWLDFTDGLPQQKSCPKSIGFGMPTVLEPARCGGWRLK